MDEIGRRGFFAAMAAGILSGGRLPANDSESMVCTVRGSVRPEELGVTLMHEHVMVDFIGAEQVSRSRYDPNQVFEVVLPHLKRIYNLGCRTLVECTPAYIGRDAALLQRLSMESGLHLITNTGYYAAADHKYVPRHAYEQNADQIAHRWIEESSGGIEQTGIKPGIIKIGVNKAPLPAIDRKLVEAAALTHKATGLKIASHTGDGAAALEQMDILRANRVPPSAFIWVHAHNEANSELHLRAAELGAWVEFDGISEKSEIRDLGLIRKMVERGCLKSTLISMDAGWYHVGEPGGGSFRAYETMFTRFVPALKKAGIPEQQIHTLLVENPRRCLMPAKINDRHFKDGKGANNEHA